MGDEGLELSEKSSRTVHPAEACSAESGAVGSPQAFWLNLGLGREWVALSEATRAAVSELPLAALRELAALTVPRPRRKAMWSQIGTVSGGLIWGLLVGLSWGPTGAGRRRYRRRGGVCWREAGGWSELSHASPLYDSSHHFEATNKR